MVRPVHGEERALAIERGVVRPIAGQLGAESIGDVEQVGAVAVATDQVFGLDLRAVGRRPGEPVAIDHFGDATPDDGPADPGLLQDLRHLGDVAEHVRQVSDRHRPAELLGTRPAELQVPDDGLAGDEELVQQDLPRPDREAPLGDQAPDQRFRAGRTSR